jgi:hypothetical protein
MGCSAARSATLLSVPNATHRDLGPISRSPRRLRGKGGHDRQQRRTKSISLSRQTHHRPRLRTSLRMTRSRTAPIVAAMIAARIPEPRWIPSRGNSQSPIKAPMIPRQRSATRPKPVPLTIWPASQPAINPTSKMTSRLSPDIVPSDFSSLRMFRRPHPRRACGLLDRRPCPTGSPAGSMKRMRPRPGLLASGCFGQLRPQQYRKSREHPQAHRSASYQRLNSRIGCLGRLPCSTRWVESISASLTDFLPEWRAGHTTQFHRRTRHF